MVIILDKQRWLIVTVLNYIAGDMHLFSVDMTTW